MKYLLKWFSLFIIFPLLPIAMTPALQTGKLSDDYEVITVENAADLELVLSVSVPEGGIIDMEFY